MSTFEQYTSQYTQFVNESKAEEITKLLRTGTLTKAQVAKACSANYSQVHTIAKKLLSDGEISQPPMGKKGRSGESTLTKSPIKRSPVVAKSIKTARPVGVKPEKSSDPMHQKIDQVILHMIGVIDDPTYSDLVTAAAEAIPSSIKDAMTTADAEQMVRDRVKALAASGEVFQNRDTGVFSLSPAGEDEVEADDTSDDDVLAFKRDDDGDDDDSGWMKDYFDSGRKTGGYHL